MATKSNVQPLGLSKLTEQVSGQAQAAKERGRALLEHRDAYSNLKDKLETISDTMRHTVMVPLTSKAFMPGELVHTNEILVLLGDNWFIETSAKNAAGIAGRRLEECDKMLEKVEEEVKLIEGWQKQAKSVAKEKEDCVDIREEFDVGKEKEWKDKHRENVKKEREKSETQTSTDDNFWKRLEELEVQEALDKEWESEEESSEEETETEDDSDPLSDSEICEPNDIGNPTANLGSYDLNNRSGVKKLKRRVSWGGVEEKDDENEVSVPYNLIQFQHSSQPSTDDSFYLTGIPHTPSDLHHFACQKPKPILKHTGAEILVKEVPEEVGGQEDDLEEMNCEPAVQERVLERAICDKPLSKPEEPKRVSKFKATRLKGK